jgi:hypothetical protein
MNTRVVDAWVSELKQKIRRLNFNGAGAQLNSGNMTLARSINSLSPSLKRYFDELARALRYWRSTGVINPGFMSVEAFESAEATAYAEYKLIQQMMAQEAERAAAQAQAAANAERRRAEAAAANAERRAQQAAENARRERNAAARRNAERRNREAAEARRAAKQAVNEARFAAAERERMERTRKKANEAARNARETANKAASKATNKAAREAARQANLKARMNAATQRARQAARARQAGETPGVVRRPGAATQANFNALRAMQFVTKNQFNAFLQSIKNGGGRSAFLKAKVKYAPMTSNNTWAVEKISRAWNRFYSS